MAKVLVRVFASYLAVSVIVGCAIYALIPGLAPVYLAIAIFLGWGVMMAAKDKVNEVAAQRFLAVAVPEYIDKMERASAMAAEVRQEPWFADSVVDLEEVGRLEA